jgi:predicted nucleic acid-binding protein
VIEGSPFDGGVLLADTSVWRRADRLPQAVADQFALALQNNRIAITPVITFEVLYRAAQVGLQEFERWRAHLGQVRRVLIPDGSVWATAQAAYDELARRGELMGKSMTDIVVAATATEKNIPVLHIDKDYEAMQALECLDFDARRLVPRGTQI